MLAANSSSSSKKSSQIVCTMKPLLDCLQQHPLKRTLEQEQQADQQQQQQQQKLVPEGDISQCQREVAIFEKTCSKSLAYVHDREGLEDTRSGFELY
ncbi:hypothetical protein Efla_000668 [Eimeria flavescens]